MTHFSSQSKLKKHLPLWIGIFVSSIAMYWFFQGIDWNLLQITLSSISFFWVGCASLLLLLEFVLRAIRWKLILKPTHPHHIIPFRRVLIATILGATANTLFPLRAGEILKPYIIKKEEDIPFTTLIATTVMERVYDIFGLVFVLISMLWLLNETALHNIHSDQENAILLFNLQKYGGFFGVFALCCMMIFFYLATRKEESRKIFMYFLKPTPLPIQNLFLKLFDGFVVGLGNSRDIKDVFISCMLSILLWSNGVFAIYCLFQSFNFSLPLGAACFVAVAIALTVALPQAPGFIGVFHVAMEKTIILWGEQVVAAQGFAIVFWAVSFIPITIVGVICIQYIGFKWSEVSIEEKNED